jgi:hypothetical protein
MSRSGRPYPPEFRRQMVELVHAAARRRSWRVSSNPRHNRSATGSRRRRAMSGVAMAASRQQSARN